MSERSEWEWDWDWEEGWGIVGGWGVWQIKEEGGGKKGEGWGEEEGWAGWGAEGWAAPGRGPSARTRPVAMLLPTFPTP